VSPFNTALAMIISIGPPAVFLVLIYTLDLYASRTFKLVLGCSIWGASGAFGLALLVNTYLSPHLARAIGVDPHLFLTMAFAPIVEEIAKSLILISLSRSLKFTYFVDGAIYGFATGIGFSIIENFLYISQNPAIGVALALTRAFSTCLMHGTAAGLVGVALGWFRLHRRSGRWTGLISGWAIAITLHVIFNAVVSAAPLGETAIAVLAVGIGLTGVGAIVLFIFLGLREQRTWMSEMLDHRVGVTAAEARAVQSYGDQLDELLKPIAEQFPRKATQVRKLILLQAQLGIKRKVLQKIDDPKMHAGLERDIARLQQEMEQLRKDVGLCVMTYVRSVFPADALDIWSRMELLAACSGPPDMQQWAEMLTAETIGPSVRSIFTAVQQRNPDEPEAAGQ